jgi:hypothetical protein
MTDLKRKCDRLKRTCGALLGLYLMLLMSACASQPIRVVVDAPATGQEGPAAPSGEDRLDLLRNFRLDLLLENAGYRQGRVLIGRHTEFKLVLLFNQALPARFDPGRFRAQIGELTFPFVKTNGGTEYYTDSITVETPYLSIGPVPVAIYLEDGDRSRRLVPVVQKWAVVDTTPPPRPIGLQVKDCGEDTFTLTWEPGYGADDVMEYAVQRLESGTWVKLAPGSVSNPEVRVRAEPQGRIRVVAVDWALNRQESEELDVTCEPLRITSMRVLAPHRETNEGVHQRIDLEVTGKIPLGLAYAVEVTANQDCRLLLVNVDSLGFGYRLLPTPCRTGHDFDDRLEPSWPKRFPAKQGEFPYVGLDDAKGMEEVYAIVYEDDAVRSSVWHMVLNEICEYGRPDTRPSTPKGSRELPGGRSKAEKRRVVDFERRLDELKEIHKGTMNWSKRSFWHR